MWYFKQTAKNIWNASKGMIDNRTEVEKLLDQIASSQEQIISTNKLNKLVSMTYDMQTFNQALQLILSRIKTFKYDLEQAKKNLNLLIAVNYLIKHGATGFVDQLRSYISMFKKYQSLQCLKTYEDQVLQKQFSYQLQKIKSRARHIQVLLEDKQKLLKQKQLAMLIKQKIKLYQVTKISDSNKSLNNDNRLERLQKQKIKVKAQKGQKGYKGEGNKSNQNVQKIKDYADKIDGFMEKYLWKYVDKIDGKIQVISQKIMQNFDKYVLGQLPQNFQPQDLDDDDDQNKPNMQKQTKPNSQYQYLDYDDDDLMKRLQQQGSSNPNFVLNENLIDFAEVIQEQHKQVVNNQESLI